MTLKFLQEQLKQKSDEIDDLKEIIAILTEYVDESYSASLNELSETLVDANKIFCDEGAPHMYISSLTALHNTVPKFAQLLAKETTLS